MTDVRPELEVTDQRTQFLDPAGRKMDPHQLSQTLQRYVKQSGVNKKGRCHLFRHTMATLMLDNGADIRFIQEILGRSKLSTTEIYTRVSVHKLKAVHSATHPGRPGPGGHGAAPGRPDTAQVFQALAQEDDEEPI